MVRSRRGLIIGSGFGARHGGTVGLIVLAAVPTLALGLFFFYPVFSLIGRGFVGDDGWDFSGASAVFTRPRFLRILIFTLSQAAMSAAAAVLLGIPGAYLLYRCRFRGRNVLRALVTVPFVLPSVVVGMAFRTLFAENGPLGGWGLDGSLTVIILAHVFLNYAVVVRTVGSTWAHLDRRTEDAARSLGASAFRVFRTITLPALGPAIAAAALMVFLFCATSFGVMVILGGAKYSTLETEIYRQTTHMLDLPTAAVLSIVQLLLVTAVLWAGGRVRRRTEAVLRLRAAAAGARRLGRGDIPVIVLTLVTLAALMLPIVALIARSFQTTTGWGLDNYRALATLGEGSLLLVSGWHALGTSLTAALTAGGLAVLVGVMLSVVLARKPRNPLGRRLIGALDGVFMLPLGVSAVTVGFGFLIALDRPPFNFRDSGLLVPIAQALVATPLVVRMVLPVLRAADHRLRQAASVLGATPGRVWFTVDVPLMARALAGASAFAFAVALGEFGATSFLARPQEITLPVLIARLISRPGAGNTGMALAASVILTVLCLLLVFIVDRVATSGWRIRSRSDKSETTHINAMGAF